MRLLPLFFGLLLLQSACAPDPGRGPGPIDLDGERAPWVCEDASWTYGDTVVADSCGADEGQTWVEDSSRLTCTGDASFVWQIGRVAYDCDAYGDEGVFACLYRESDEGRNGLEEVHDYVLVGRFVSSRTAVGAFKYTSEVVTGDDTLSCSTDHDFLAAAAPEVPR